MGSSEKDVYTRDGMLWTRDEVILALGVYWQVPFGKVNTRNSTIVKYAALLERKPAALVRKIGNLGSLDPLLAARGIVGLGNCSSMDRKVWNEFKGRRAELDCEFARILNERSKRVS